MEKLKNDFLPFWESAPVFGNPCQKRAINFKFKSLGVSRCGMA
jgi:hypothetical protein